MVESDLSVLPTSKLTDNENYSILENSLKLLLNLVPDPKFDEKEDLVKQLKKCNILQPHEILGGHCIAEFLLKD